MIETPNPQRATPLHTQWVNLIRQLRQRTSELDDKKLAACTEAAKERYLAVTLPRHIVQLSEATTHDDSYHLLYVEERRSLNSFNDPSYVWERYFQQGAGRVVQAEKELLVQTLVDNYPDSLDVKDISNNNYGVIDQTIAELAQASYPPTTLLSPGNLPPDFFDWLGKRLQWSAGRPHNLLATPYGKIAHYGVTRRSAPQYFVLLRREVAVWHVVPDPDTGEYFTVAAGVSSADPLSVDIVFGTFAKLEVLQPRAMRIIRYEPSSDT